jgi:hypothetical protein
MKKWIILSLVFVFVLSACSQAAEISPTEPAAVITGDNSNPDNQAQQPPQTSSDTASPAPDTSSVLEETSGPLTARIFSELETTINQQEYSIQGWVNRAAVISANDTIAIAKAEDIFTVGLTLDPGANLVEVIISDEEGNEVEFDLTVFVEQ